MILTAAAASHASPSTAEAQVSDADTEFFEREVRPLLVTHCHKCHSERKQESSLRLDSRQGLLRGGNSGKVIQLDSPADSRLLEVIGYDSEPKMPPDGRLSVEEIEVLTKWVRMGVPWPSTDETAGGPLEPFDLEKRRKAHWAWSPVDDPPLPSVSDRKWPRDELDQFLLAGLETAGIRPAPEADRRTWLRRVTFDLTGLPPTPEEMAAFLADTAPNAYERVVDRLLSSRHFGERWARHWMDLARYAETYGHEFDYPIPGAWQYRDYLIRAFNADVPYDQFVIEHIAGDLLETPRLHATDHFNESIIGTSFWWLGEATHAPTDVRGDEAGRIDNQIDVFSKTFLGLTIACARCHDHKFDAISTADYYALAGFLQSSRRQIALLDAHHRQERVANEGREIEDRGCELLRKAFQDVHSTGQMEGLFARLLQAAIEAGPPERDPAHAEEATYEQRVQSAASAHKVDSELAHRWGEALYSEKLQDVTHPLHFLGHVARKGMERDPTGSSTGTSAARAIEEAAGKLKAAHEAWDSYEEETQLMAGFDVDSFEQWRSTGWAFGDSPTVGGTWNASATAPSVAVGGTADSGRYHHGLHGALRSPTFVLDYDTIHYRLQGKDAKIRLVLDGYFMGRYNGLLFADFDLDVDSPADFTWRVQAGDIHRYKGHRLYIEVEDAGDGYVAIDEIRFSNRRGTPPARPSPLAVALAKSSSDSSVELVCQRHATRLANAVVDWGQAALNPDEAQLVNWLLEHELIERDPDSATETTEQLTALNGQVEEVVDALPEPMQALALADGSAENEHIHIRGSHRNLGEVVRRRLPEALGGSAPSPDEQGSGRLMLAERVAAADNPLTARVMVNRVWHHLTGRGIVASVDNFGAMGHRPTHPELLDHLANRFVTSGWSIKKLIRVIVLSSTYRMASKPTESGQRLDPANHLLHAMRIRRLEGEAIRDAILAVSGGLDGTMFGPSIPAHLTPFMQGRGRPGESGPLDGHGRRSLYISVRRNFLSPMMLAFDTPIPFTTIGRRNVANVPAQALILLNDPFVAGEARRWAERLLADAGDTPAERIERMYVQALGRPPAKQELEAGLRFLQQQASQYGVDLAREPTDTRVWSDYCHVLFNVKEFILVY